MMERSELRQFVTSMEPPHHLLSGEDWKERRKSRRKVLKETWEEMTAPLQEDSSGAALLVYEALLKKKDRLEHHLEELQAKRDRYQNQTRYFQALISLWQEKMDELGVESDDRISAGLPQRLKENSINAQGRAEKETDDPRFGGTRVHSEEESDFSWLGEYSANSTSSAGKGKLRLNPTKDTLEKFGVDEETLLQPHPLTFKGKRTWREGAMDLKRRRKEDSARYHKLAQTVDLVTFRLSVLTNVLYQYEVFGTTDTPSSFKLEQNIWGEVSTFAKQLAETGLKLYNANPDEYSNRSDLLKAILDEEGTAGDVRTLQDQLEDLYPKAETSGRPKKEDEKALFDGMIWRFKAATKNLDLEENGETGENGVAD